jgi:hypothetical protein
MPMSYWDMLEAYAPQDPTTVPMWPQMRQPSPHEIAARRQRETVRPQAGRKEGALTQLQEDLIIPKTPLDYALYGMGGPFRLPVKAAMLALGGALQPSDAQAGPASALLKRVRRTVDDPVRNSFPGIYKDPRQVAQEAVALASPESPALKQLFGVTRGDLHDMSFRQGGEPNIQFKPGARGSEHTEQITNQRNANRLVNAMSEVKKLNEPFYHGMVGWYPMDPAYNRLTQLLGKEEGGKQFTRFNSFGGMASPSSPVDLEFNRGLAAYYLDQQNRINDFTKFGGRKRNERGGDFPDELRGMAAHIHHKTAHAPQMQRYSQTGELTFDPNTVKVPLYVQSSGVPQLGFQNALPVGDAHWSRGVGLADVRKETTNPGRSIKAPELFSAKDWWRDQVASPLGLNPVQAQGLGWGTFGPQTGVDSAIGAPKLEILSDLIMDSARRNSIQPATMRDMILMGERYPAYKNMPYPIEWPTPGR